MASTQTIITVRVTPRSGRDVVMGRKVFEDGVEAICVRVTAPPDGGKANKAVCKTLASSLGIPKSALELVSGHTARRKQLAISEDVLNAQAIQKCIESLPNL